MPNLGRGLAIGFGEESAWGTAVSRTIWVRGISESMKRTVKKTRRPVLYESQGSGNRRSHFIETDEAGGTIEFLMGYEGLGMLLRHCLYGTPATSGSGPTWTHVFKLGLNAPTGGLTIEVIRGAGDVTASAEVFEGCRVNKATFKIEAGGLMRVTLDLIAETSGGRVSPSGTPTFTTNELDVIHHQAGSLSWNSVTYATGSLEWSVDNKLSRRFLLGSKLTKDPKPTDFREITLKVDVEWENNNFNAALTADTEADGTLTFSGLASRSIAVALHNAYIDDVSDPINAVGVVKQSVTFYGQSDGTDEGIQFSIVNTQSSAEAA